MITSKEYTANLKNYRTADGIKAIILYIIYMAVLFLQGFVYTTNLDANIINILQIIFPLFLLIIGIIFIFLSKEKMTSVGLTGRKLWNSLFSGIALACCFIAAIIIYFYAVKGELIGFQFPSLNVFIIFIIGAVQEEIIFRGYIQTRLTGIIKNTIICSLLTAFLFIFMHYPTHFIAGGFSLKVLSAFYVICLLILHFLCDMVYKRTNCLWGAIMLHFLYNVGQSMIAWQ